MDQSKTFTKLLRVLRFRRHVKELTSACKRINKDGCYEFVTGKTDEILSSDKKSSRFGILRSKKQRNRNSSPLLNQIQSNMECITVDNHIQPLDNMDSYEHLLRATPTSPANLSMIISQSYKPLHAKPIQLNDKNTIAVTKDTAVHALYTVSNWAFIEIFETGETGFVPIYCLRLSEPSHSSLTSSSQDNISLFNVSTYKKPRYPRPLIVNNQSYCLSIPSTGRFISSIGPCHINDELQTSTYPHLAKTAQSIRQRLKDQSVLSQQISNMSLHMNDSDAYETLNLTSWKSLSLSMLDNESISSCSNNRLRIIENYQRQFIGDVSVLESEIVTLVNPTESIGDWRLVKRGDGQQGYIPEQITLLLDQDFT